MLAWIAILLSVGVAAFVAGGGLLALIVAFIKWYLPKVTPTPKAKDVSLKALPSQ